LAPSTKGEDYQKGNLFVKKKPRSGMINKEIFLGPFLSIVLETGVVFGRHEAGSLLVGDA
jgi:hypothetical protein